MKRLTLPAAAALAVASIATAAAYGAGAWHALSTQSDSGKHGAFVNIDAVAGRSKALGVTTSRPANVRWNLSCTGLVQQSNAGEVIELSVGTAAKCTANAVATTGASGALRVQIVRR